MKYPIGTKMVVVAGGVGVGYPALKLGEQAIITKTTVRDYCFTIDGVLHSGGWCWDNFDTYFKLLKKKPTIII